MPFKPENKLLAKQYVDNIRANTFCNRCGKQPIEWHNNDHIYFTNLRIAHLVALGFSIERIQQEIDRCEALCRSCHMKIDGRLKNLRDNCPNKKGLKSPPKICVICGELYKPLRKGRCNKCNWRFRKGTGP